MNAIASNKMTHAEMITMLEGKRLRYTRSLKTPMTIFAPDFGSLCSTAVAWGINPTNLRVEACGDGIRGTVL